MWPQLIIWDDESDNLWCSAGPECRNKNVDWLIHPLSYFQNLELILINILTIHKIKSLKIFLIYLRFGFKQHNLSKNSFNHFIYITLYLYNSFWIPLLSSLDNFLLFSWFWSTLRLRFLLYFLIKRKYSFVMIMREGYVSHTKQVCPLCYTHSLSFL